MSDLSESLICHERPEQFAHSRSFVMRDLSNLLTVAYLSWAIWANCSQSLIWFERWANERIPSPDLHTGICTWPIESTCCWSGSGRYRPFWPVLDPDPALKSELNGLKKTNVKLHNNNTFCKQTIVLHFLGNFKYLDCRIRNVGSRSDQRHCFLYSTVHHSCLLKKCDSFSSRIFLAWLIHCLLHNEGTRNCHVLALIC